MVLNATADLVILVVEDEALLRQDIADTLREEGFMVWEAAKGEESLALLRRGPQIELLITDVRLPNGITGWDVAEASRAHDSDLPVIYASGNPLDKARRGAQSAFISKPYSSWQFLQAYYDPRSH